MARTWLKRTVVLILCMGFCCFWASALRDATRGPVRAVDFAAVYFGARCAMKYRDPYLFLGICMAEGGFHPPGMNDAKQVGPEIGWTEVYPPTSLFVIAPLAFLPYRTAEALWTWTTAGLLVLAGLAVWDLAQDTPLAAGCFAGLVLLNREVLLVVGNLAGMTVALCVVATWCFIKERFRLAGVAMLATSLALKPHDPGFVWLFFLLNGGAGRKRAVQTLALTASLGVCALIWAAPYWPNWVDEIRANFAAQAAHGDAADQGPMGSSSRSLGPIVDLENSVGLLRDDPRFYDPFVYLLVGGLIAAWAVAVLRKRPTRDGTLLALAAISVLELLLYYHRTYDAKLLLLTIPGCAVLWAAGGPKRWIALGTTAAAIFVTSDIPIMVVRHTRQLQIVVSSLTGKLMFLAFHPAPVVLLVTGCFYLWVYIRYVPPVSTGETTAEVVRATEATV